MYLLPISQVICLTSSQKERKKKKHVLDMEESWVFANTALVIWTAVFLTSYSDYLTGFYEPLSPPYKCDAGLKNVFVITG